MSHSLRDPVNRLVEHLGPVYNRAFPHRGSGPIVAFDPAMATENLGDEIIMHYCSEVLRELFGEAPVTHVSTHRVPTKEEEQAVRESRLRLVCGTNLLTSHIEINWNWRLPDGFRAKLPYRSSVLLGVGWGQYQDECSGYSRMIYRWMLDPTLLHSVRDSYAEEKLRQIGITNVLNTGCPTTWRLTPEFCAEIPTRKAADVVTTLTDYRRDPERDQRMLEILGRHYETVYLWPQGKQDRAYLRELHAPANLKLLPETLEAYDACLRQDGIEYVGTRLHAGIFALNHRVRTLILAVDNRAIEMGRDTNLPVILREKLEDELEAQILRERKTQIRIPLENIRRFREQFRKPCGTHQNPKDRTPGSWDQGKE